MLAASLPKAPASKRKRLILLGVATIIIVLIASILAGYLLVANKIQTILPGNPIDAITKNDPLKATNGRTNILLFGTSYDDPNPDHSGGYLTDSLVVLSVDERTNTAHTVSVPRDLWIDYGMSCTTGESGKINATYLCALDAYGEKETDRASRILSDKVGAVLGLEIQYYLEVNYTFIQSLTDALGGIDVNVYSADERGIYDRATDLKLPAGSNHLDGKTALKLARARNSNGGYGLPRSNFDREINQQRIIAAMFRKASTSGSLNDPASALRLINALSGQVRTNVQTAELRDAVSTAKSINTEKIISIPLTDYMTTGNLQGTSIVRPVAGLDDYSAIQAYISETLRSGDTQ